MPRASACCDCLIVYFQCQLWPSDGGSIEGRMDERKNGTDVQPYEFVETVTKTRLKGETYKFNS